MHYFPFNIEAYIAHTRHLTPLEDIAYRRILDLYYLHEKPLAGDAAAVARAIGMRENVADVATVLAEFFVEGDDGWRNRRADEEIEAYHRKLDTARRAGRKSAAARATAGEQPSNERPTPDDVHAATVAQTVNARPTTDQPAFNDRSATVQPTTPIPIPSTGVVLPPPLGTVAREASADPPDRGGGVASPGNGDGERGESRRELPLFDQLCRTGIRSKAKNRRAILSQMAEALEADGMVPDQLARLTAKAKRESSNDPWALLASWLDKGTWRDKWDEIVSGRVANLTQRIARQRRAQ